MMLVSYMKVAWVLCAILLLPATPWASEEKKFASVACSDTVLLRVSDGASRQGSIAVVEVRSETPLDSVDGFAAGETLFFWHDADARVFQALLGVDLRRSSGTMSLRARVAPQFGEPVDCRLELPIGKGEFPVQRLAVAPKYVELSADDLARSQRESRELDRIFSSVLPPSSVATRLRAVVQVRKRAGCAPQ